VGRTTLTQSINQSINDCGLYLYNVSQLDHSSSLDTNVDSGSSLTDSALARELEIMMPLQRSKSRTSRLASGLHNLFTPHGHLIMSTLQDVRDEQQRLNNAITALRAVHRYLLTSYTFE